ncbi:hypothetical protein SARC_00192 [Sphaeroforma arctica JP610]|uniref:Sec-independent protein translocase protein TatB n=1 Tax=Sphaeroforma arctica JP610 TaxID=667725 RepID=A0A0L0GFR4_9EUKA|nr:hypothetical protein SARC_00192 [Sphaeroforma arctica JP610]KNC87684.1 hypothetical protein SARC_00192 [Sphaeroforma arctica JP610]|eukprot:XP_014161586.1 hypothetical protein SARC_00192 [Sphaeroforma arctica JP610]
MFGLSEVALIGGVAYFVVGPNELPRVARNVGYMLGQLFRVARSGQGVVNQFVKQNKLDELQKDFSEGVAELHALRSELQNEARKASPSYQIRNALTRNVTNTGGLSYSSITRTTEQPVGSNLATDKTKDKDQPEPTPLATSGNTYTSGVTPTSTASGSTSISTSLGMNGTQSATKPHTGNFCADTKTVADDRATNMKVIQQHMVQAKLQKNTGIDTVTGGADILGDVLFERALARHQALEDPKV